MKDEAPILILDVLGSKIGQAHCRALPSIARRRTLGQPLDMGWLYRRAHLTFHGNARPLAAQHLLDQAKAQGKAEVQPNREVDHLGRKWWRTWIE
ncbi:hypothetical protein [Mesorhizobium captivum]|uniref:hypothetical protein n=1 Tax=Mesorhizobium captivum TaxID=3072319 RepID=UPI003D3161AE